MTYLMTQTLDQFSKYSNFASFMQQPNDTFKERIDYMSHDSDKLTFFLEKTIQLKDEEQEKLDVEPDLNNTASSATEESTAEGGSKKWKVVNLSSATAVTISGKDNVFFEKIMYSPMKNIFQNWETFKVSSQPKSGQSITCYF